MADYDFQHGRPTLQPEPTEAQHEAHEDDLRAGLIGLTGIVAGGPTVEESLKQVADFAVHAIPGTDGVGVTVAHRSASAEPLRIQTSAVTAEFVRVIDTLQCQAGSEGPSITCMRTRRPAISGSIADDRRWPTFGPAVADLGVNSVLALPLLLHEEAVGSINAYAHTLDAFAEHAVTIGAKFAVSAAVSVYNARLLMETRRNVEQLQHALVSRSVIDQAIGIIRGRSGTSAEEAFDRLVEISQNANVKLYTVAERLVEISVRRARERRDQP